jgi:RHS repeat-associated protein
MQRYTELYQYDAVGNFQSSRHVANAGGWTRSYQYAAPSLLEPAKQSNRLTQTSIGTGPAFIENYQYADALGLDAQGCMTAINNMGMVWDFNDRLQQVDLGGGGTAYYVYDAGGERARKVIESQKGVRQKERIYVGGFEVYREFGGGGAVVSLQRESLHVMDDKQRIALVETQVAPALAATLIRYQLGNHLGSASVELDENGALISYEEYHPYGTTAFQAGRSSSEVGLKRYRYTGKERDEETGFSYHGARYYAAWISSWLSCDPAINGAKANLYCYAASNPISFIDPDGREPQAPAPAAGWAKPLPPPPPGVSADQYRESQSQVDGRKSGPGPTSQADQAKPPPKRSENGSPAPQRDTARLEASKDTSEQSKRFTSEQLEESIPILPFFVRVPTQYVRPYQKPLPGAPVGLDAIRQLNGQPSVGVANFSRDLAPGTSITNLTLLTVSAINSLVTALSPLANAQSMEWAASELALLRAARAENTAADAARDAANNALLGTLQSRLLQQAGFAEKGAPIILDENLMGTGVAEGLRSQGYNVRSISEIFGRTGIKDPVIREFAEASGARVLTADRGRQLGEGFGKLAIQVDARVGKDINAISRYLSEALKK